MKVTTDQTKSYRSASEALADQGFEFQGAFFRLSDQKEHNVFTKDGDSFAFNGMDHYNTTVYSVNLKKINLENFRR